MATIQLSSGKNLELKFVTSSQGKENLKSKLNAAECICHSKTTVVLRTAAEA